MTEVAGQIAVRELALNEVHARLGATMTERDGWFVPASYVEVEQEYAAVREAGAGLIDLSSRGRLLVSGSEAVQFLNGLITNDMKTLEQNCSMPAAFPNVQGRLIASVRVIRLSDEEAGKKVCPTFLIDTEAATSGTVLKTIERFTLAGDFRVNDISSQTVMLSLQGANAASAIDSVLGEAAVSAPNTVRQISWQQSGTQTDVTVIHASHTGASGFDLIVENDHAERLWNALQQAGAQPLGYDALEVLRVEAGIPRYGADMDDTNVVTETNLDDAVSYTKGCYVGQEIIARIKYRGHVAKKLSGLICDQGSSPQSGNTILSTEGKEIGRVTSTTHSPQLGQTIALGYLKYDYLTAGTAVNIVSGNDSVRAFVTELPFIKREATNN